MSRKRGFTLIELLVTIAIIGILSSIVLASLGGSRDKANIAKVQTLLKSAQSVASLCLIVDGQALTGTGTAGICVGGSSSVAWPTLPTGWTYGAVDSSVSAGTFSFSATKGSDTVSCDQSKCTKS